jgi:hypothetical protein
MSQSREDNIDVSSLSQELPTLESVREKNDGGVAIPEMHPAYNNLEGAINNGPTAEQTEEAIKEAAAKLKKEALLNIEKALDEADDIFKYITHPDTAKWMKQFEKDPQGQLHTRMVSMYTPFAMKYPIILRMMTQFGMYKRKAFKLYLKNELSTGRAKDEVEYYCERPSRYAKNLWIEYAKKKGMRNYMKEANAFKLDVYNALKEETEEFKTKHDKIEKELKSKDELYASERKEDLLDALFPSDD